MAMLYSGAKPHTRSSEGHPMHRLSVLFFTILLVLTRALSFIA